LIFFGLPFAETFVLLTLFAVAAEVAAAAGAGAVGVAAEATIAELATSLAGEAGAPAPAGAAALAVSFGTALENRPPRSNRCFSTTVFFFGVGAV
jgi:hypothetical protein